MNNMGTNGPTNGPNSWRAPSAGNLPSLPGMNSSASEREEPNFPPGNRTRLKRLLALEPSINTVKHYENKFTKTFRPTDILHIFTKF